MFRDKERAGLLEHSVFSMLSYSADKDPSIQPGAGFELMLKCIVVNPKRTGIPV